MLTAFLVFVVLFLLCLVSLLVVEFSWKLIYYSLCLIVVLSYLCLLLCYNLLCCLCICAFCWGLFDDVGDFVWLLVGLF